MRDVLDGRKIHLIFEDGVSPINVRVLKIRGGPIAFEIWVQTTNRRYEGSRSCLRGFDVADFQYQCLGGSCSGAPEEATDENLSASGPRFTGATPDEWRAGASHRITFSNNIIAEGLSHSTHAKIEHSKGSLIHDNTSDILIYGNLYAHNVERSPLFKGGVRGVIVNNLIYDPGPRALHYNLMAEEWGDHLYQNGQMVAVGNVLHAGPSTPDHLAFLMIGGYGDLEYYGRDNIAVDQIGRPLPMLGRYTTSPARIIERRRPMLWPEGLTAMPAAEVQRYVLHNAGARPWDRDHDDVRLIADVGEGRGRIIDSENDVGGYPVQQPTHRAFNPDDWNLADMSPRRPEVLDSGAHARGT